MTASTAAPAQFLTDAAVRRGLDLLMVGYRHYRDGLDEELAKAGLGQAHHRAIYFIHQNAMVSPKGLCALLSITKQSLGRVMNDLRKGGFVEHRQSESDRRSKQLFLTEKGIALERRLYASAERRMKKSYAEAGQEAVQGYWSVLTHLLGEESKPAYDDLNAHRRTG